MGRSETLASDLNADAGWSQASMTTGALVADMTRF